MPEAEFLHLPIVRATEPPELRLGRDARLHLALAVFGSVILILNQQLTFQLSFFLLLLLALFIWRIPVKIIAQSILPVVVMMSLTILYHFLFFNSSEANYGARPILYSPALDRGLFYALRLGGLYLLIIQLVRTVSTDALADAFVSVVRPLRYVGLPVVPIVLALRAGLSSIPALSDMMRDFEQSLKMSNVLLQHSPGSYLSRLNLFPRLFSPMLVAVTRRADQLALAIRARGYLHGKSMTIISSISWRFRDTLEACLLTLILILLWRWTA